MLFFCCAAIVCFHRDAYLLKQHDILLFARTPFDLKEVTPASAAGHSEVQASEYHKRLCDVLTSKLCPRCPVRLQAAVRIVCQLSQILCQN
jgi:hypothetical protein